METNRAHPLILTAAAAVIITCGVAVASITGLWPSSKANEAKNGEVAVQEAEKNNQFQNQSPVNIPPLGQDRATMNNNMPPMAQAAQTTQNYPADNTRGRYAPAPRYDSTPLPAERVASVCHSCGRVVAIRPIKIQGEGTGIGAVAGGVAGALIGHQFGNGNGRKALTVAGAAGGAYLGNNIEKDRRSRTVYDVQVRFEDGRTRKYRESHANWQVGDRVRVNNGRISSDS